MQFGDEKMRLRTLVLDEKTRVKKMRNDIAICKAFMKASHGAHAALCKVVLAVQKKSGNEVKCIAIYFNFIHVLRCGKICCRCCCRRFLGFHQI